MSLTADRPLAGIRVLSMEQAAALPFATRHLADLGAEVIRVQSHRRGAAPSVEADLTRNKRQLAIDLAAAGGPEAFLRVAAGCDVVAHNFTPRVMRRFGIDYEGVRRVRPDVIYVSLTGFGTTGPWSEKPLFGPGAEAVSGHNLLIGDPEAWPGRPGTIVYADNTCGLNAVFAVLAALDERDRTGRGQHIDISLYETAVSHLGPIIAGRAFGSPPPERQGNRDGRFAVHGVFAAAGADRHVAIAARAEDLPDLRGVLGLAEATEATISGALAEREAEEAARALQRAGVSAAPVADSADQSADAHLWERGFFGVLARRVQGLEGQYPHAGPAFGGGEAVAMAEPRPVGADTRDILIQVAGMSEAEVGALIAAGAAGEPAPPTAPARPARSGAVGVERGELSRIDQRFDAWRRLWDGGRP
jgi:crotonobetainyl-CoA:carnitine CoA-transferase CaiB-like acyl-CoA transferase